MTEGSDSDKLVCLKCGADVSLDESVCPSCGSDRHLLQSKQGGGELPKDHPKLIRKRSAVYWGIATIVLVALAIVLVNAFNKPLAGEEKTADEIIAASNHFETSTDDTNVQMDAGLTGEDVEDFAGLAAKGSWHVSRGEWAEAIGAYEKALALKNDDIEVIEELTLAYLEVDDIDGALFHLNRWAEINPADPRPHALKGSIFFGQGKLENAREEYKAAVKYAAKGDRRIDEYVGRIDDITRELDDERRAKEEAEKDIGDGWIPEEWPQPAVKPDPQSEEKDEGGITPFSQFFKPEEKEPKPDDKGTVLIGDDAGQNADEKNNGQQDKNGGDSSGGDETSGDTTEEGGTEAAPIKVTGARFEATDDDFSIYLDTLGRATPKYSYDENEKVFWLTIPNADCDFTSVPRERTFIHPFVELIKTWSDEEGNVRFKIILKEPIQYTQPTVLGLGISIHLRKG